MYGFLNLHGFDATDDELIAIIRRIEGQGDSKVSFEEFDSVINPIIIKMTDIKFVDDQGKNLARNNEINEEKARPLLKKMQSAQPISN